MYLRSRISFLYSIHIGCLFAIIYVVVWPAAVSATPLYPLTQPDSPRFFNPLE